jgi:hypothetical protein
MAPLNTHRPPRPDTHRPSRPDTHRPRRPDTEVRVPWKGDSFGRVLCLAGTTMRGNGMSVELGSRTARDWAVFIRSFVRRGHGKRREDNEGEGERPGQLDRFRFVHFTSLSSLLDQTATNQPTHQAPSESIHAKQVTARSQDRAAPLTLLRFGRFVRRCGLPNTHVMCVCGWMDACVACVESQ